MTTDAQQTTTAAAMDGEQRYDVVIIGGGAAGLSGALTLARARRSVLVIDAGQPRNAPADGIHGYLGREGTPPGELLAAGRAEVTGYGGEIVSGTAATAERRPGGEFRVVLADGTAVLGARLLVTTGLVDELPTVPGVAERWGREVLHCPYCHGWEVRDQRIGILGTGPLAVHQALMWRQWSSRITLFLHTAPEPGAEEYEKLAARDIAVVTGEVSGLVTGADRLSGDRPSGDRPSDGPPSGDRPFDDRLSGVRMADGREVACQALVIAPRFTARSGILAGLGLEITDQEMNGHVLGSYVAADPLGATAVPGVWVAGNVTTLFEQVIGSAAAGVRAGSAINADLTTEDTDRAVAARRAPFSPHVEREVCERVLGDRRHGL
ncbi:NAD(P)/FAD-dependent oxidoreductase [Streptomyces sp. RKAG293]|uniref:NAD(P)/FAD-dependent oxidoreductase n=1 Tax=Streptomyces sp. RKAG293 TaxID=2893403 RepID=UPI0020331E54|nr:NAD(P)/FAD-dependent oxidoreductase [Streptomyces sp. RKAG293]MCM2423600.1 NAD(P)/FAD-dependent oxidoreductase [Streptomyces sp. RKAG293]